MRAEWKRNQPTVQARVEGSARPAPHTSCAAFSSCRPRTGCRRLELWWTAGGTPALLGLDSHDSGFNRTKKAELVSQDAPQESASVLLTVDF